MKHAECPTPDSLRDHLRAGLRQGALIGVVMAAFAVPLTLHFSRPSVAAASAPAAARLADFHGDQASNEVHQLANWVADSGNAGDSGYVIIDKKNARAYAFDAQSQLQGASPVLLGLARGDDLPTLPGSTPLKKISDEERTTPAGRFVGQHGHDDKGDEVVWVDYASALAMHRVMPVNPGERRFERIDTPGAEDNRISYGCINVPAAFFDEHINPLFKQRRAVVYILPEVKSMDQVFGGYKTAGRSTEAPRNS